LGNINSKRDWGFAGDYVEMMWKMLQHDKPDTYVIATGEAHTIREFVEEAGKECGFNIIWEGQDENEKGFDKESGKLLIKINQKYFRPAEVDILIGDPEKAKKIWIGMLKLILNNYAE
jgi:GDPmannose 4,6-dehydratase